MADDVDAHIDWLKDHIEQLENQIKDLAANHQEWSERQALLQSTKGIGPVISIALLVYLPELGRLNRKRDITRSGGGGRFPFRVRGSCAATRASDASGRASEIRSLLLYVHRWFAIRYITRPLCGGLSYQHYERKGN